MSSVPGALEIVSCSARLSREIAANVSAIVVNRRAFVFDTGATTRAASSSSEKKPWMSVFGSARFAMTEVRRSSSSGSRPIASLRSAPRPLRASPKPTRLSPAAWRVGASNIPSTWSSSTGMRVWRCGSVAPSASVRRETPRSSSTYFRPSAERGRTVTCESAGTAPSLRSSFSVSCAPTLPPGSATGCIPETTPTRKPPERTSLPGTRFAPLARSTLSCVVGTNGRPEFALYARKTATTITSTVTAPTSTGLATTEARLRRTVLMA